MTWCISDVHGCYYTLIRLIDRIRIADPEAKFVFVGDYVDRGPHSKKVIDYLLKLQKEDAFFIRGNHEDIIDWLLNNHSISNMRNLMNVSKITDEQVMQWWLNNGLLSTLESYGINAEGYDYINWTQEFKRVVPDDHKHFIKELPVYWENDTHFVCHAYMQPSESLPQVSNKLVVPIDKQESLIWERYSQAWLLNPQKKIEWNKIGVFGHTPVSFYGAVTPIKIDKLRLIDTKAYNGEYLCGYCCELDDHILQATDSKDVKIEI